MGAASLDLACRKFGARGVNTDMVRVMGICDGG